MQPSRRAALGGVLALASLLALGPRPALADVQYFYDEVGRLVEVVDATGASAQYVYDPAGNIVQILRVAAGTVSVAGFTPKSGPVGTAVTIYGSGFDTAPANNAVQFNGTAATVTGATASQLTTSVPTGATSGTISVTVGTQTATSADTFTVTSSTINGPPTITGFTPGGGPPGTAVTIAGTNFDTVAANDTVRFSLLTQAAVTSSTATQIVATVPINTGSGPIQIRTPYGSAQSADDFIIPPAGYNYADIVARVRIAIDGAPGTLSISPASKHGLVLFDGAAGDYLSLQLSALTVTPSGSVAYAVFDPTNAQIATGNVSTTAMSIHLPPLGRAGTYAIFFSPGAATANLTFNLTRNSLLSASQPSADASVGVSGQSTRAVFAGTAGQPAAVRLGIASTTPANQTVTLTVYKPDGSQLAQTTGSPSTDGAVISVPSLSVSGNYTVLIVPWNAATGTMTVTLNPAMDITADGASVNVSDATAGYVKRLLFTGTAGQNLTLALSGLTYSPASGAATVVTVYNPDGTALASAGSCLTGNPGGNCSSAAYLNNLPVSGVYTIAITPPSSVTFSGSLTLSSQLTGTLVSGTPFSLNLTRIGQTGRLSFSGTAGQAVTVRLGIGPTTPANQTVGMTLNKPDGTNLAGVTGTPSGDGATIYVASLPLTGTYQVFVGPYYEATGTMTVTLNPAMDIVADGASVNVSDTTAGYTKRLLFTGTAGQNLVLALTGLAYTPSSSGGTNVIVNKPDGTALASAGSCVTSNPGGNCSSDAYLTNLPVSGVYTIAITPPSSVTFGGALTLSSELTGTLVSGTPFSLNLTRAGQIGRLSFDGTAGQAATVRLGIGPTTPANQTVEFALIKPDGTVLVDKTGTASGDGVVISVSSLPLTGTYKVFVGPWYEATGTMTVTLNPAMDITADGASVNVSDATAGYVKRLLFTGTAGQNLALALSGLTYSPASGGGTTVTVYKPDGTTLSAAGTCLTGNPGGNCSSAAYLTNLPVTGVYTIVVTPPSSVTFSGSLTLSSELTGTLVSGTPFSLNLTRIGQTGRLSFSGTAGQAVTVRLGIGPTTPANQTVSFVMYKPDGSTVASTTGTQSGDGALINVVSLPVTGTYSVWIGPWYEATGAMTVTLNPVMDITADSASVNVSDATAGYIKRLLFTGTAGQNLTLALTGLAYSPASGAATGVTVYKPDGTTLSAAGTCLTGNPAGNCSSDAYLTNLPVTGVYTIVLTPPSNVTFSASLTLSSEVTGTLDPGGTPFSLNLARAGQSGRLSFSGTAGQPATVRLSVGATTPASQTVSMTLYAPDGSTVASTTGTQSGDGATINVASLPVTGTYNVWIGPWYEATGTMTVTLNPAMDIVADGASVNVSDATAGYVKRLLFTGTAGQNLMLALTGLTYSPASGAATGVSVYKPNGTGLASAGSCLTGNPGGNCNNAAYLTNLPVSGVYTIVVTPPSSVTFSGSLTLSSQLTGTLVSGTPFSLNLARPGQIGRLYFSGTAGQAVTVHLDIGPTTPADQRVEFALIKSDGTVLVDTTGTASGGGATISVPSLPVTGTYQVFVGPYYEATGTMTVTLNP